MVNPGETKEIISFQNIQKNSMAPAAISIIDAEGVMNIKIKGTAYFQLFGWRIPVPFDSQKQISIYDEIQNKINVEIQKNLLQQDLGTLMCGDGTHVENDKCVPDSIVEEVASIFDEIKKTNR